MLNTVKNIKNKSYQVRALFCQPLASRASIATVSKMSSTSFPFSTTTTTPRYHLTHNPPYQINHAIKNTGKKLSSSKRRITFQFGFSDPAAIASGIKSGNECRGGVEDEHEVVCIWSSISGKVEIYFDGALVVSTKWTTSASLSTGNEGKLFRHSWSLDGCHMLEVVANVGNGTPRIGERVLKRNVHGGSSSSSYNSWEGESFHKFDLTLDGMSYFNFAKIYELGNGKDNTAMRHAVMDPASEMIMMHPYRGARYVEQGGGEEEVGDDDARDEYEDDDTKEHHNVINRMAPSYGDPPSYVDNFSTAPTTELEWNTNKHSSFTSSSANRRFINNITNDIVKTFSRSLSAPITEGTAGKTDWLVDNIRGNPHSNENYSLFDDPATSVVKHSTSKSTVKKLLKLPSFGSSSANTTLTTEHQQWPTYKAPTSSVDTDSNYYDCGNSRNRKSSFSLPKLSIPSPANINNTYKKAREPGTVHDYNPWSPSSSANRIDNLPRAAITNLENYNHHNNNTITTFANMNSHFNASNAYVDETVPQKEGTFATIKRKLSQRMDCGAIAATSIIAESRQPSNDTSNSYYVDPGYSIDRSPSAMSYEYELMKESRSFAAS